MRRMWYHEFGEYPDSCIVEGCRGNIEIKDRYRRFSGGLFCSRHENNHYDCQENGCCVVISSRNYCSQHNSACGHCGKRTSRNYCDNHSAKCQSCSSIISYRETYCSSHKENCYYGSYRCQQRVSSYREYCEYHRNCCKFESCSERIPQYNSNGGYCHHHGFEEQTKIYKSRWESEKNRASNLQNQLNTANSQLATKRQEVVWLQEQLKMLIGEEEYQAQVEANYPPNCK